MKMNSKSWLLPIAISVSVATLAGCNNNDDNNSTVDQSTKLLIANDLGGDQGTIESFTVAGGVLDGPQLSVSTGLAEGIVSDSAGNIYQAGINGSGTLRSVCSVASQTNGALFNSNVDRSLTTALTGPKGTAIAQDAGLIFVSENGAATNAISVFGLGASNAASTLYSIPRSVLGNTGAWDVAYDESTDRLFVALINGDVAYFADYLANATNSDNSTTLTPTSLFRTNNALAVSNIHGIVYDAVNDRLVVSDVADAAVADDGSIYVFEAASTLAGTVSANRTIRGALTTLGNPVDLQLRGKDLFVAEKANGGGKILIFGDISNGDSGDIAPDRSFDLAAPESLIAAESFINSNNDISDLTGASINSLYVTSNPANVGTSILPVSTDLLSIGTPVSAVIAGQFVESISLDQNGDAIVSFDDGASPSSGGISFVSRLAKRDSAAYNSARDHQISGSNTTLVAPKGVETVGSMGLTLIADLNAAAPGAIKAFSNCADDNASPVFTTTMPAGTRPWDLDYDTVNDRLYVAATNGTIQVYDNYLNSMPTAPSRVIDPDDQSGFSASNIHGIVHDEATDRLIVSDVGDAAVATDGRIYVIENASSADGLTSLKSEISGPLTLLGNPVDLAFDGTNLYVAEKSNNQIQRIDDIYSINGSYNLAPTVSLGFVAPESIALSPDYLPKL